MKPVIYTLTVLAIILTLSQCKNSGSSREAQLASYDAEVYKVGEQLLQTYCVACHNPDMDLKNRLAPPMVAVKDHYLEVYDSEGQFIQQFIRMVQDPAVSETRMPNAVKKFGLMPKMPLSDDQLSAIATYVYHTDMENPQWLEHHYQQEQANYQQDLTKEEMKYLRQGKEYANQTQLVLAGNLKKAIAGKGIAGALTFCNQEAIALTDSMQTVLQVGLRRVSDLNRNPNNEADLDELAYIFQSKKRLANQEPIRPRFLNKAGKKVGYYPIMTIDLCLHCHGESGKDIEKSTIDHLTRLYPEDKAIGYNLNELRGIWVVGMNEID
ncbi:MAG: DUF3365 domain-containing protein [Bacteroidia bacterium]|nr:DUF3365 domain-containing protein [Bacteroidia bacterium]